MFLLTYLSGATAELSIPLKTTIAFTFTASVPFASLLLCKEACMESRLMEPRSLWSTEHPALKKTKNGSSLKLNVQIQNGSMECNETMTLQELIKFILPQEYVVTFAVDCPIPSPYVIVQEEILAKMDVMAFISKVVNDREPEMLRVEGVLDREPEMLRGEMGVARDTQWVTGDSRKGRSTCGGLGTSLMGFLLSKRFRNIYEGVTSGKLEISNGSHSGLHFVGFGLACNLEFVGNRHRKTQFAVPINGKEVTGTDSVRWPYGPYLLVKLLYQFGSSRAWQLISINDSMTTRNQEFEKALKDHELSLIRLETMAEKNMSELSEREALIQIMESIMGILIKKIQGCQGVTIDFRRLKLRYAAVHLEGRALQWHQSYIKIRGKSLSELPWNDYVRSISTRFASRLIEDAMGALKALNQTSSLDDYCDEFDLLLNKVSIPEKYAISLFLEGLKPEIRCHVKLFKPTTLRDSYSLARLQNQAIVTLEGSKSTMGNKNNSNFTAATKTPYNSSSLNNSTKLPLLPAPIKAIPVNHNGIAWATRKVAMGFHGLAEPKSKINRSGLATRHTRTGHDGQCSLRLPILIFNRLVNIFLHRIWARKIPLPPCCRLAAC
ncbi:hypothetical protein E3N88_40142 [Mikania micrantha]|uniref:Ty3 transposon capsid-like protein domain-containing protein n=1 Tax=Mikania micrantha TaxID=192012 RepID=A0A5N6LLW5_9ASTR|nr:hypothetical protein E3N88_40142 [Mikania micrantha]